MGCTVCVLNRLKAELRTLAGETGPPLFGVRPFSGGFHAFLFRRFIAFDVIIEQGRPVSKTAMGTEGKIEERCFCEEQRNLALQRVRVE